MISPTQICPRRCPKFSLLCFLQVGKHHTLEGIWSGSLFSAPPSLLSAPPGNGKKFRTCSRCESTVEVSNSNQTGNTCTPFRTMQQCCFGLQLALNYARDEKQSENLFMLQKIHSGKISWLSSGFSGVSHKLIFYVLHYIFPTQNKRFYLFTQNLVGINHVWALTHTRHVWNDLQQINAIINTQQFISPRSHLNPGLRIRAEDSTTWANIAVTKSPWSQAGTDDLAQVTTATRQIEVLNTVARGNMHKESREWG